MSNQWRTWSSLLCLTLIAFIQPAGAAKQTDVPESRQITLNVLALDKSGQPISDLQQQDFRLLDNKVARQIKSFRIAHGPGADLSIEAILVVDEVNDSLTNMAYERGQLAKLFQANGGELPLPVSLVFFSDSGAAIGNEASRDGKALLAQVNQDQTPLHTIRRSQGFYGANDRLQLSLRVLEQLTDYETTRPGRKLVIWVSPGWPLFDYPNQGLTQKTKEQLFASVVRLSTKLREANVTLDSVDPLGTSDTRGFRTSLYKQFIKGVRNPSQAYFGDLGLQVFAYQSGGRVLNSSNDVVSEIHKCISDPKAFYILSFEAALADGSNEYHAIEVKIDRPGITARTLSGYYAQPEQTRTR
jgi:VWFA-related protein